MSHSIGKISLAPLSLALNAALLLAPAAALGVTTRSVTSCADDNGATTLRAVMAASNPGDTVDLTTLPEADAACVASSITLTQGQISIAYDLTIVGPGASKLAVIGTGNARVFYANNAASYLEIRDITVSGATNSTSKRGGCINALGELRLDATTISGCSLSANTGTAKYLPLISGGGVFGSTVRLSNGTIVSGNALMFVGTFANASGGGVGATHLYCTDSTITGNVSTTLGGGAYAYDASIQRCTIDSNYARYGGGLLSVQQKSALDISESTISGNRALRGGGVFASGALTVENSTIAFNSASADNGAGIDAFGDITLTSTIVAQNFNVDDNNIDVATGGTIEGSSNLIMYSNDASAPGAVISTSNPHLTPLGNHGGLTRTHALLAGSPAVDAGRNTKSFAQDQRGTGFAREIPTGKPDIGAYERQAVDDEIFYDGLDSG